MKTRSWLWSLFIVSIFFGCASERRFLMFSEVISRQSDMRSAAKLSKGDYVSVMRCPSDPRPKSVPEDPKTWGVLDSLLEKARRENKGDYFLKATIYLVNDCVELRGYKGIASSTSAPQH